jgi:predicted AlkP superfamily phosphohydrolase/phosphomutase
MKPLMDKGLIPNFKSIYELGNRGILKSVIPPLTPPGWASIYTGKNPGKHGLFEFSKRNGYAFTTNTCWDYNEAPPVWKYLADHGKRCVLLNVPMYYPPLKMQNCYSVSGFTAIETLDIYHPESLRQELLKKIPNYRIDSFWRHNLPEGQEEAYIKGNIELTKSRIKALNYLMKEKTWDFFFVVFTGTDRMQHFFWDEIIKGNPEVTQYYRLLDEAIGHVLNSLRGGDFLFIVSDHGFCPIQKGVNINKVLQQQGLLSIKKTVEVPINYRKLKRLIENWGVGNILKNILPRKFINKLHEHTKIKGVFSFSKIDWTHTKAFASSGLFGGICINLKNREPSGIVSESKYNSVRDNIIQAFSSLKDNEGNGGKVIKNVYRREELYSGKYLHEMPDLVLLAETGYRFDATIDHGDIFREPRSGIDHQITRGEHEVDSIFMFKHDDFNKRFNEVSVIDIAPSVLNLFELPIPTSMDGKSLFEEYKPPIYRDELTGVLFKKQDKMSSTIKSKLKNLRT